MLSRICTVFCVAALALGFSSVSMAAGESAEPATLIVYRADESVRTERLGLDVHMDKGSVGRLKADKAVVEQIRTGPPRRKVHGSEMRTDLQETHLFSIPQIYAPPVQACLVSPCDLRHHP